MPYLQCNILLLSTQPHFDSILRNTRSRDDQERRRFRIRWDMAGDLGYLGTNLTIPMKASKLHQLTQRQKDYNTRHSRKRIIVEHVLCSLKAFRILSDRFRGAPTNYHSYFLIACGLRALARSYPPMGWGTCKVVQMFNQWIYCLFLTPLETQ